MTPTGRPRSGFSRLATWTSRAAGRPVTFLLACATIAVWGALGPIFHFSDTWQLVINTATTIVTFLMVFLIQNTQNRDAEAIQLKLDEIIRAMHGARNEVIGLEELEEHELDSVKRDYQRLAGKARARRKGLRRS